MQGLPFSILDALSSLLQLSALVFWRPLRRAPLSDPFPCPFRFPVVLLVAWVGSVSAQKQSCRPQTWNPGAGVLTGQGSYAVGRAAASVVGAAAVDRAQGVCASVMMPAVSATKASSVEVPGDWDG